jgi:hypothetical protein
MLLGSNEPLSKDLFNSRTCQAEEENIFATPQVLWWNRRLSRLFDQIDSHVIMAVPESEHY